MTKQGVDIFACLHRLVLLSVTTIPPLPCGIEGAISSVPEFLSKLIPFLPGFSDLTFTMAKVLSRLLSMC